MKKLKNFILKIYPDFILSGQLSKGSNTHTGTYFTLAFYYIERNQKLSYNDAILLTDQKESIDWLIEHELIQLNNEKMLSIDYVDQQIVDFIFMLQKN